MRTAQSEAAERRFADRFQNFTLTEMQCNCGKCLLPINSAEFVSWCEELQSIRTELGFPLAPTSWYRCPNYNDDIYIAMGADPEEHLTGPHTIAATDLIISFERMYLLIAAGTRRNLGIGIKQHGDVDKRYVHVDNQGPRIWTYK